MPNAPKATPAVTAVALHTGGGPWFKAIMIVASTTTPSHDTTVLKPMDAVSALRTSTFDNAKAMPEERASRSERSCGHGTPSSGSHRITSAPPIASDKDNQAMAGGRSRRISQASSTAHTGERKNNSSTRFFLLLSLVC